MRFIPITRGTWQRTGGPPNREDSPHVGSTPLRNAMTAGAVIEISQEVADVLASRGPVVALETTLVAHGFPAGEGLAVGLAVRAGRP